MAIKGVGNGMNPGPDKPRTVSPDERALDGARALMARDIFYEADIDGKLVYLSPGAERYGFSTAELIGADFLTLVAPEHRDRIAGEFARTLMTGEEFPSEIPIVNPGGRVYWFEDCAIVRRENGTAVGITGFLRDISQRRASAEHLAHVRDVLDAHRSIGKLMLRATSRQRLIQGVCDELVRTRSYQGAWIALVDASGRPGRTAQAGIAENFDALRSRIERGILPECWAEATVASGAIVIEDPAALCTSCPIVKHCGERGTMSVKLEYSSQTHGFLNVSLCEYYLAGRDEVSLLEEVAGDIAYALHNMEVAARRRDAELALSESESKYHMLLEDSRDAVYVTALDGAVIEANPAMLALFGLTREEMLGADAHVRYADPDDRSRFQRAIERTGTLADYEVKLKKQSGEIMDCLLTTSVRRGLDGAIIGYHGIIRDVTEQKEAERALFESEKLYRSIFELSPEAIVLLDRKGTFLAANDRLTDWLDYPPEEVVGHKLLEMPFFTLKSKATVVKMFLRRMSGRPVAPYDLEFVARNGTKRIGRIVGAVIRSEEGKTQADIVMISDVTEQRVVARALEKSHQKIEGLHNTARSLEASDTEEDVCRFTVDAAETVLGFRRCVVMKSNDNGLLVRRTCSDIPAECLGEGDTIATGPAVESQRTGRTVPFGEDAEASFATGVLGLRCGICVPLGSDGVFCAGSDESGAYGEEDIRLLELLLGHTHEALRRIRLLRELQEKAIRDPMTGLYNRRHFTDVLEKEMERGRRYGHGIGFLMIDVNDFKAINDRHGHQTGDAVLREVAQFL
ncbi:PAS domain S-box protein, partial [bacterium]|nr:PAS domain S-box protein [bacterium]